MTKKRRVMEMTYNGSKVGESGYEGESGLYYRGDGQRFGRLSKRHGTSSSLVVLLGLALLGCASSNTPAESPAETSSTYPEASSAEEVAPSSGDEGQGDSSSEAEGSSGEPASSEDLKQALQVVIQDESLLSELKLGEPGRFPLKIAGQSLPTGLELQAHSEAVEVVSAPADAKTVPVLIFTNIDITNKQGTFKYRFDVEGVRGTSYVEKNELGVWELKSSRVSEY